MGSIKQFKDRAEARYQTYSEVMGLKEEISDIITEKYDHEKDKEHLRNALSMFHMTVVNFYIESSQSPWIDKFINCGEMQDQSNDVRAALADVSVYSKFLKNNNLGEFDNVRYV